MIAHYPEALNQHPGSAGDVIRMFLMLGIPIGFIAYLLALWLLLITSLFIERRTTLKRQAVHVVLRAAVPIGTAFALFLSIWTLSAIVPGTAGAGLALSLILATFVAAIALSGFIMHRSRRLNVSRLFSDSWWLLALTVPLLVGAAASISAARQNAEIARRERATAGVVTSYEPTNYLFTFAFQGRTFEGASPTNTFAVGQHVTIYFDPVHPQTNSLEDFARTSRRQMRTVPFCLLGILAIAGGIAFANLRQARTANHHPNG
jgi:glucan phosphoethanolaminetransferase (alkaline phosphatase superfamily)